MNNSLASPSVLAHLCCQKIEYSLPFYRQTKEWLRAGLKLSVVTLSNWFIKSAKWLKLSYNKMHEYLIKQEVLHADETVYQILKRSDGKPPTSQSRIWLFRNSQHAPYKIIMYHSTLTRARSVAQEFLKDFSGYLHCDGYTAYHHLPNIELSTCWAHVRRKFREAGHGKEVKHCLAYCNELSC